ncbi:ABC transporter ATP-binding protein [Hyphococcus sp.]|uniref:ABC transporter ATP-binding protein n=1 Tax=Hyphococcus sp. TaxID=2038636 RepID=UPI003CCB9D86
MPDPGRLLMDRRNSVVGVKALQGVSFELNSADRLAVIGHNGSGKTTLLQVLAGIFPPDGGSVTVQGRTTSLINLNFGMAPDTSGHKNILLRGLAAGHSREVIESKREEIAAFSELGEFLDLPVETYSAGMRMRLSFAIATAFEPEILILDEWLSAGDASFRNKASVRMQEFVGKAGILILASHSRKLIEENCNRALWLEKGKVRAFGDVEPLLSEYENSGPPGQKLDKGAF